MLGSQFQRQPSGPKLTLLEVPHTGTRRRSNAPQVLSFVSSNHSLYAASRHDPLDHSTKCTDIDPKKLSMAVVGSPLGESKGLTQTRRRSHVEVAREYSLLPPTAIQKRSNRRNSSSNAPITLPVRLPMSPLAAQESGLEDAVSSQLSSNHRVSDHHPSRHPSRDQLALPKIHDKKSSSKNRLSSGLDLNQSHLSLKGAKQPEKIRSFKGLISQFFAQPKPKKDPTMARHESRLRNLVLKRPQPKKALQDCCWAFCF